MKISEKLKTDYPMIEESVLNALSSIIEGNNPDDIQLQEAAYEQYVLAEFIASGEFERHINRTRRRLRASRENP